MATLSKLILDGILNPVEIELDSHTLPWRLIFSINGFGQWLENDLANLVATYDPQLSSAQQVDDLMAAFVSGDPLVPEKMFRPLHPHQDGVWELKTPDVRIFGWFACKDNFIAARGNDATFIKRHNLYHGYIGEVVRLRNQLDLDPPKFVTGVNADDVISNRS